MPTFILPCLPSRAIGKQAPLFLMLVVISFFVPPANVIQSFFVSSNIATSYQEKGEPVQEASTSLCMK